MALLTDDAREAFVNAYLARPADLSGACAAAGIPVELGRRALRDARTIVLLSKRRQAAAADADISAAAILRRLAAIAFADPRELVMPVPSIDGETGAPTIDVQIADGAEYSPEAAALYAGAKRTRDGVEIKMHDQLTALKILAAYAGIVTEAGKVELGAGKDVREIIRTIVHPSDANPD